MIGDSADFVRRLYSVLPRGWFSDVTPVTSALLTGFGAAWASIYGLIQGVTDLTRITTSTGSFLDLISLDYFGDMLPRRQGETDATFTTRIKQELFRLRGTRSAVQQAVQNVTGRSAFIVEPARPGDTGGYSLGGVGYGQAGAWGNLSSDHTFFVTAFRPTGSGITQIAGYGTGGPIVYGNIGMVTTSISDIDIRSAVIAVLPLATTAWLRIEN